MKRLSLLLLASLACSIAAAEPSSKIYAQELIDRLLVRYPDVVVLAMHVTAPKSADNVIIASNIGRIGKKADEDDLRVIHTGQPNLALNKAGDRFEVELVLRDANARPIGALGVVFPYKPGDDKGLLRTRAEAIRDELARRISHVANLLEPAQYDASIPTQTYGQSLVEAALAKHPRVVIMALHANLPHSGDNVIVASNIGRIGKKADEDDLNVIRSGTTKLELNESGDRYEVEQTLQDVSGRTIGAVGIVYAYKKGADTAPLRAEAAQIRAELRLKIASVEKLLQPR